MYQFFYIRKSAKDKTIGTIYEAVFDDRTPIRRVSLKLNIPLKLWDDKWARIHYHPIFFLYFSNDMIFLIEIGN